MADVTWTQEQLAAITARNPGILVSAGAGSGKTAVLTERVVQRIFDPVDPVDADRMLIVTFTRAAAEEMRERIAVKLRAVQREHPEDSSVARQLILLEKADISTVHAFCQRIVKENFQLLDIQSGFRIADEKELEVWRTEAAGEILEEEYAAEEESFLSLVELLSEERSDRRVTDTLLRLYDFVRAHPFYEAWLEQALERYRSEAPIGETDWGKLLIADALSGARQALEAMEEARDLLDGDEKIQKAYGSYVATLYAAAKGILDCLTAGDWDGAYQAAQHIDGRFSALRGYEDEWKKARVTALRDQAKELLEDLRDEVFLCTEEQFQSDRRALLPMVEKLFAMTAELDRRYARAQTGPECPGLLRPGASGDPAAHRAQPGGGGASHPSGRGALPAVPAGVRGRVPGHQRRTGPHLPGGVGQRTEPLHGGRCQAEHLPVPAGRPGDLLGKEGAVCTLACGGGPAGGNFAQ